MKVDYVFEMEFSHIEITALDLANELHTEQNKTISHFWAKSGGWSH